MRVMNKTVFGCLLILLLAFVTMPVMAKDDVKVEIDGQQIHFDVQPQLMNNRTMVPLRAIFEALGATVEWDGITRTVTSTKGDTTISLTVNDKVMIVNNCEVTLDSPACIVNGRTLVPVRAISEAFGIKVDWNGASSTVSIITKEIAIEKITFNNLSDSVTVGETKDLSVSIYPQNATYKMLNWTSSDINIVTVDNGKIKGISEGTANIICSTNDGIKSECKITVTPAPVKATAVGVYVDGKYIAPNGTIEISVGDTIKLNPKVIPENSNTNTDITWGLNKAAWEFMTVSLEGELTAKDVPNVSGTLCAILPDGTMSTFNVVTKKATVKIELRDTLPKTLCDYDYNDDIETCVKVTGFEYEVSKYTYTEKQTVTLIFSGEKTIDDDGPRHTSSCKISWKLYDKEGYVVDSGTCYTVGIAEGEKFRNATDSIFDISPGKYYLELLNTK